MNGWDYALLGALGLVTVLSIYDTTDDTKDRAARLVALTCNVALLVLAWLAVAS